MSSGLSRSAKIQWGICFGLALILFLIPEVGFYTVQIKAFAVITVFCLALAAFELVPLIVISILLSALYIFFNVAPAATVMAPWMSTTPLLVVGALFMCSSLEKSGLLHRIAYWMMSKMKGSYFFLLLGLMIVCVILNILTSGNGFLIVAALAYGVCASLDGLQGRIGAGVASAVMIGGCTSHAYTYYAPNWAVITGMAGDLLPPMAVTPLGITLHNWPLFLVSLVILCVVYKMTKPEEALGDVVYFEEQLARMGKITKREKVNAVMLCVLLVYIFTISIHKMDLNLGFAVIPWLVFLPGLDGADEETVRGVNFSIVFFVMACMAIGTVATSLGVGDVIGSACAALLNGNTSPIAIMGIVFAIVFVLNFVMTPLAIYALLATPILTLAIGLGYDPVPFAYAINACSEAILMPYEYVPYLLVYSFGMIAMKDFIKINVVRSILFFAGFIVVLVPYWMLIGLL